MSERPTAPAGWYPNQHGQTQWWDGAQWGPLAPIQHVLKHPQAKSVGAAYCFLIFLGGTGAHRFYLGDTGRGIAMLLLMGGFFIGTAADLTPLPLGCLLALWIMQLIDLFTLAGDVKAHNGRLAR